MRQTITVFFWLSLLSFSNGRAQVFEELNVAVDTTELRIGEQLNITFQIKADSLTQIQFPERLNILPFELLEEFPLDTLRTQSHYLFTKKYAVAQFDSGNYWIPPQRIIINDLIKLSDSIPIRVNTVVVDTLKQPLYDIKPLIAVERKHQELIQQITISILVIVLLILGYFLYKHLQRKLEEKRRKLPPFDRALLELKELEKIRPILQQEYKEYYSKLTEVVRTYLEEEAKVTALESTSGELLEKLELLKDSGRLDLESETLRSLKKVLDQADLVKFARSTPQFEIASRDRTIVEDVVIKTQEALPEPTQEEIEATEAYKKLLRKQKRQKQIKFAIIGVLGLFIIGTSVVIGMYGFRNVSDTVFKYPTKILMNNTWVESQYGTPPIVLSTPEVLVRTPETPNGVTIFSSGDPLGSYFVQLSFTAQAPDESNEEQSDEEKQEAIQEEIQAIVDDISESLEDDGATNMLINPDPFVTKDGSEVFQLSGSLDLRNRESNESVRCRLISVVLPFESVLMELRMIYPKDDRYGGEIEAKILKSLEILKKL